MELDKRKVETKTRAQRNSVGLFTQHIKEEVLLAVVVAHLAEHPKEKLAASCAPTATEEHTWKVEVPLLFIPRFQNAKSRTAPYSQSDGQSYTWFYDAS